MHNVWLCTLAKCWRNFGILLVPLLLLFGLPVLIVVLVCIDVSFYFIAFYSNDSVAISIQFIFNNGKQVAVVCDEILLFNCLHVWLLSTASVSRHNPYEIHAISWYRSVKRKDIKWNVFYFGSCNFCYFCLLIHVLEAINICRGRETETQSSENLEESSP